MKLGIIDADLLDNGTRHPNLACMKISAYYKSLGWKVTLLENYDNLDKYDLVTISRVFSFTHVTNVIYKRGICKDPNHPELSLKKNIRIGGTGFYFDKAPDLDYCIEHIMPDYHLYDEYIYKLINKIVDSYKIELSSNIEKGKYILEDGETVDSLCLERKKHYEKKYCDYLEFSIGFAQEVVLESANFM